MKNMSFLKISSTRNNKKGFILIVVLITFSILVLTVSALGFRTRLEIKKAQLLRNRGLCYYQCLGAINMIRNEFTNGEHEKIYSPQETWITDLIATIDKTYPNLAVEILDEQAKININTCTSRGNIAFNERFISILWVFFILFYVAILVDCPYICMSEDGDH